MDQTFTLINGRLKLFYNKNDRFGPTASTQEMPEFGALKEFSDSLAILEVHWESSLEEVLGQTAKTVRRTGIRETGEDANGKRLPVV